jgi:hypothetical protein
MNNNHANQDSNDKKVSIIPRSILKWLAGAGVAVGLMVPLTASADHNDNGAMEILVSAAVAYAVVDAVGGFDDKRDDRRYRHRHDRRDDYYDRHRSHRGEHYAQRQARLHREQARYHREQARYYRDARGYHGKHGKHSHHRYCDHGRHGKDGRHRYVALH